MEQAALPTGDSKCPDRRDAGVTVMAYEALIGQVHLHRLTVSEVHGEPRPTPHLILTGGGLRLPPPALFWPGVGAAGALGLGRV